MPILEPPSKRTSGPCLSLLLAVLSLGLPMGCSTHGIQPIVAERVLPEESCLQEAEPLPLLTDPTIAGMVRNHAAVADMYWQLAARHSCLVEFNRR